MLERLFLLSTLGVALALVAAPATARLPAPVSPGDAAGALIHSACPTFSWSAGEGSGPYELVVYPLTADGGLGMEVSWQVTGIRQDAYAERNPIAVEEDKGELRGRYLHPEAHDQPAELAVGYVAPPEGEVAEEPSAPPVAVSPQGGLTVSTCPTFSWSLDPEASGYELVVYGVSDVEDGSVFLWDDIDGNTALGRLALSSASGNATGNTAVGGRPCGTRRTAPIRTKAPPTPLWETSLSHPTPLAERIRPAVSGR